MRRISPSVCAWLLAFLLNAGPFVAAQDYAAGDSVANWDEGQNTADNPNSRRPGSKDEFNPYIAAGVFGGIAVMGVIYFVTRPRPAAPAAPANASERQSLK